MTAKPEQAQQIIVADWMRYFHPEIPFFHIANERKCSIQQGAMLKRMGVTPGVFDLFFPKPSSAYSGLFIEMKVGKNKPTPNQLNFQQEIRFCGYKAEICYGADATIDEIKNFYSL